MSRGTGYCEGGNVRYIARDSRTDKAALAGLLSRRGTNFSAPFVTTFSPYVLLQTPRLNISVETKNLSLSHGPISVCTIPLALKMSTLNAYCLQQKPLHVRTPKTSHRVGVAVFLSLPRLD
jgi:hypothetical protein